MKYKIFSNIIPAKGYLRSVLYDLETNDFTFVPNELSEELIIGNGELEKSSRYFKFLHEKGMLFAIKPIYQDQFVKLNLDWNSNCDISNILFHYSSLLSTKKVGEIIKLFSAEAIQIIVSNALLFIDKFEIENLISYSLSSIEIIFKDKEILEESTLTDLLSKNPKIKSIFVLNSNSPRKIVGKRGRGDIYFLAQIEDKQEKSLFTFPITMELFTESQFHHTYFNRKLFISSEGEIKNAPECKEIFGNINSLKNNSELINVVKKPEFQKIWFVRKDICDVCKECEFRYMCVDNRIPKINKNENIFFENECNYNSSTMEWKYKI